MICVDLENKQELENKISRLNSLKKKARGYTRELIQNRINTFEFFLGDLKYD